MRVLFLISLVAFSSILVHESQLVTAISTHTHARGRLRGHLGNGNDGAQQVLQESSVSGDLTGGVLRAGTLWPVNTRLWSASGASWLQLQRDGIIYSGGPYGSIVCMTGNTWATQAAMQTDCNFVLKGPANWNPNYLETSWDSGTTGYGTDCYAEITDNGRFSIRAGNGTLLRVLSSLSPARPIYGDDYYMRCGAQCYQDDTYASCSCLGTATKFPIWSTIRWTDCVIDQNLKLGLTVGRNDGRLACMKLSPCRVDKNPCGNATNTGSNTPAGMCTPSADYSTATCSCSVVPDGYFSRIQYGGPHCDQQLPLGTYANGCDLSTCSMSGTVLTCSCGGKVQSVDTSLCHIADYTRSAVSSCSATGSTCQSVMVAGVSYWDGALQCTISKACQPSNNLCPTDYNAVCVASTDMKTAARCNCINNGIQKRFGKWCDIDGTNFPGTWYKSCDVNTCTADGSVMTCTCGGTVVSLDFSLCLGPAIISNGRWLCRSAKVCALSDPCAAANKGACIPSADQRSATCNPALPNGPYSATCQNCKLSNGLLTCSCPAVDGSSWNNRDLTMSTCGSMRGPRYAYGGLVCDPPLTSDCPNCLVLSDTYCAAIKGCLWKTSIIRGARISSCEQNIAGLSTDPVSTLTHRMQAVCRSDPSGNQNIISVQDTDAQVKSVQITMIGSGKSWCQGDAIDCSMYDTTSRRFISDGCSFVGRNPVTGDSICSCQTSPVTLSLSTNTEPRDVDIRCCSQRPRSSCSLISGCSWAGSRCTESDATLLPESYHLYDLQVQFKLTLKASKGVNACSYGDNFSDDSWRVLNGASAFTHTFTITNSADCTKKASPPTATCTYVRDNNGQRKACTANKIDESHYQCVCPI